MAIKHFLFDLDGTLLPLDEPRFLEIYLSLIGRKFASLGMEPKQMIESLWRGTNAMILNDGEKTNEQVFWDVFYPEKEKQPGLKSELIDFYKHDFKQVKASTRPSEYAGKIIGHLKKINRNIFLLTNPIFPEIATFQRIEWAGLLAKDFKHITTYENAYYAKPNIKYYQSILEAYNLDASETMMVGNDVEEDMIAIKLGMEVFLITDCLKNDKGLDISQYRHGTLEVFYQFLLEQY